MFFTNLFQIHKKVHLFPKEKYAYKIHFKSIFWFFAINISVNIYVLLDTVMLGFLSNDSSVGLYSAAAKLSRTVVSLIASMCTTFIPRLSYYAGMQKIDEYQSLLDKTAKIVLFLSIPASLGLFVLSKEAIILYSGINFIDSIPSMRLFSLFLSLSIINNFLGSQILLPNNKEKLFFLATLVGAISDIIFNFLLIPRFNYMGATIATFTSEIVVFIICYHGAKEYLSTKKLLKQLIKYFLASIPIPCIAYIMRHLFTSTVIISISTCICSIILYCFLLFIMKDDVMQYINSIILKHIKK